MAMSKCWRRRLTAWCHGANRTVWSWTHRRLWRWSLTSEATSAPLTHHCSLREQQSESHKFLGTIIQQDLKWDIHSIIKKVHQSLFFVRQLKKCCWFNSTQASLNQLSPPPSLCGLALHHHTPNTGCSMLCNMQSMCLYLPGLLLTDTIIYTHMHCTFINTFNILLLCTLTIS